MLISADFTLSEEKGKCIDCNYDFKSVLTLKKLVVYLVPQL